MKKVFVSAFIACFFIGLSCKAVAQEVEVTKDDKKETQEIVIRKKGDKDANINIQISGDKVTVNGKPLVEFKDDEITVNKRKLIVRDGDNLWLNGEGLGSLENLGNFSWSDDSEDEGGAFLGVTTEETPEGAKINDVTEGSAAAKAGLKEGDVITKVGDAKIEGPESLYKAVSAKKPKDEVKIYFLRDGKEKSVKANLQERKNSRKVLSYSTPEGSYKTLTVPYNKDRQRKAYAEQQRSYDKMSKDLSEQLSRSYNGDNFNFDMAPFPRQKKLGLKIQDTEESNGVKVLEVADSSASATAGIKKDDIITEIAGVKVTNTDEVREQLQENAEKSSYNIKALRNGTEMSFDIKIPKKLKTANL